MAASLKPLAGLSKQLLTTWLVFSIYSHGGAQNTAQENHNQLTVILPANSSLVDPPEVYLKNIYHIRLAAHLVFLLKMFSQSFVPHVRSVSIMFSDISLEVETLRLLSDCCGALQTNVYSVFHNCKLWKKKKKLHHKRLSVLHVDLP